MYPREYNRIYSTSQVMASSMEKALAMGKQLELTGEKLEAFIDKNEPKFAAEIEREERKCERELKQKEMELQRQTQKEADERKQKQLEAQKEIEEIKIKAQKETEEQRLKHEIEMEQLKLEALKLESDGSSNKHESTLQELSGKPKPKIPFFEEATDEMDSYLERFEWIAEHYNWDRADWPFHLSQYLKGKATEAYTRLAKSERKDYDVVKEALLRRYNLTDEGYRKKFRESQPEDGETPQQFIVRLKNYLEKWIELSKGKNPMDLFLIEQFISACPPDVAAYLKQSRIESPDALAEDADRYLAAHGKKLNSRAAAPKKLSPRPMTDSLRTRACMICKETGHLARDCARNKTGKWCVNCMSMIHNTEECKSVNRGTPPGKPRTAAMVQSHGATGNEDGNEDIHSVQINGKRYVEIGFCRTARPTTGVNKVLNGYVDGKPATILRDTGCNTVLVARRLVDLDKLTGEEGYCLLADGTARKMELANLFIDTPFFRGPVSAMVSDNPIHDLLLGNIPGARPAENPDLEWSQCNVMTRAQTKADSNPMKPLVVSDEQGTRVDRKKLIQLQKEDNSIQRLYSAKEPKKKGNQTTRFFTEGEVLFREYVNPMVNQGQPVIQVVVPTPLRKEVMQLAHNCIMSGHLGTQKTMDRILFDFFWPGMSGDVKRFCQSCDICQKTVKKGSVSKVPLQKTPIIDTPFKRCAVDLIGPIHPPSEKGHRYILTLVDYATRYPEAVALKEITSEVVAEALLDIYSRVGIPEEVISDQGSQFISDYMKEFSRLLGMKQLPTTPYHAMANGLVERFNGTLKSMLKKLCAQEPNQWHRLINAALFAYREVPQESTGFAPFELLYGRSVRGPISVLKQMWTQEEADDEVKSSYQYVMDLREKLEDIMVIATQNLKTSQNRYKKYFDKGSRQRCFEEGDEVLILLPTDANKLLMQWRGPYKVLERKGLNNYRIEIKGKSKTYHVNMLKRYHVRPPEEKSELKAGIVEMVECATMGLIILDDEEQVDENAEFPELSMREQKEFLDDVQLGEQLNSEQTNETNRVLKKYEEIFSDKPGNSTVIEHEIKLTTSDPIRSKAYKLPFTVRESLKSDIEDMLKLGVIRKSSSPYASPIVIVKKPDGSNRICADFRRLNKVTVFDPEPMTTADDLFRKLAGDSFFSKLDLSKGYWQIPVKEQDVEKTAFVTPDGHYEFLKMPFGMVNSGATLVRGMRQMLEGLDGADSYIDDIIVHTNTWEDHLKVLQTLLGRLRDAGFTVRPSKCQIGERSIEFIGHSISRGIIQPLDENVAKIQEAVRPKTKTQVRSFNGLTSYYRDFIPNYAAIAAPLTDLTKKGEPNEVIWGPAQEKAFLTLKKRITEKPILRIPDVSKRFVLRTDASDTGIGAVLLQTYEDKYFPVSYASRKLLDRETNYSVIEKECLALIWAVKKFQQYLYGVEFTLQTDHQPLIYINSAKYENSRVMRWALVLQSYRIRMESIRGVDCIGADYMSRMNTEFDN